jgi:UDP:flavonoid glycosyltransferase YjiC (YdhE family)
MGRRVLFTTPSGLGHIHPMVPLARAMAARGHDVLWAVPADGVGHVERTGVRAVRRDLRFEAQSNEEARTEMSAAMPPEYVDAFFSFFVDGTIDETTVLPTVREILGREPRSFAQWVASHLDVFG